MVAAIVAGVGAVVGGVASYKGSQKAADAETGAAGQANATQLAMYDQSRKDATPYRETGYQALNSLAQGMGLQGYQAGVTQPLSYEDWAKLNATPGQEIPGQTTADKLKPGAIGILTGMGAGAGNIAEELFGGTPHQGQRDANAANDAANQANYQDYVTNFKTQAPAAGGTDPGYFHDFTLADFNKDPGYEFRRQEGQRGVETSAAARGGLLSGGALKGIDQYNQNYATGEYSNAYNRFSNDRTQRFNRLSSLAGTGQTAVTNTGNLGQQTANNISNNTLEAGNARAASSIATGNAINGATQTLGNYYMQRQYAAAPQQQQAGGGGGINSGNWI